MPIYEYKCCSCSACFELRRGFSEDNPVCCPHCGGSAERIFSPVPVIFKGSGFYATDSRGNHGHPADEGKAGEAKAGEAKTDEAKTGEAKTDSSAKDN